jgi:hypothetical protein
MAASTLKIAKNELNSIPYFTGLIKMDCVRFEPTTSAMLAFQSCPALYYFFYLKVRANERRTLLFKSQIHSTFSFYMLYIACTVKLSFENSLRLQMMNRGNRTIH